MRKAAVWSQLLALLCTWACSNDEVKPLAKSADSGFQLERDAFKFENFAYGYDASLMTPELAARMFGEKNVCRTDMQGCVPNPDAQAWIDTANAAMDEGRCEGFAVLSQLFFLKRLDPMSFGADTTSELELEENYALQRELAYWFSTQLVPEAVENKALMPREAVPFMAEFMKPGAKEFYRIGMVERTAAGFGDAHSLTPLGFTRGEKSNIYYVRVYDNNFPDVERQIRLDVDANTWEYRGVTGEGEIAYAGGEKAQNPLYFAATTKREGVLPCPFCKDSGTRTITVQGAQPLVTDPDGHQIGIKDGKVMEEAGGKVSPGFGLCTGNGSTIQLTAKATSDMPLELAVNKGEGKRQSVTIQGGSLGTVSVSGELSTGSKSGQMQVSQDSVTVQPAGGSSRVSFTLGTTVVDLDVSGDAGNVHVSRDPNTGKISVKTDDAEGTKVTVTLTDNSNPYAPQKPTTSYSVDGNAGTSELGIDVPKDGYKGGDPPKATVTVDGMTSQVAGQHCSTGQKDGDETDVDCGGSVCGACQAGKACTQKSDCAQGTCAGPNAEKPNTCVDTCSDGRKDDDEADVDCGGACAIDWTGKRCAVGKACNETNDCTRGVLQDTYEWSVGKERYTANPPAHCENKVCVKTPRIQGKSSLWASGIEGLGIRLSSDGVDQTIWPARRIEDFLFPDAHVMGDYTVSVAAQPPAATCEVTEGASGNIGSSLWVDDIRVTCTLGKDTCQNKKKDASETDLDCGGPVCLPWGYYCALGAACSTNADCGNPTYPHLCINNVCKRAYSFTGSVYTTVPVTVELTPGGDYSGPSDTPQRQAVKFGSYKLDFPQTRVFDTYSMSVVPQEGVTCTWKGLPASPLTLESDWVKGYELRCTSCANGTAEAYETDVDCGGNDCRKEGKKCGKDQGCLYNEDCASNTCVAHKCTLPPCENGTKDTGETDIDCGGSCVAQGKTCGGDKACSADTDCTSGSCDGTSHTCAGCSDGQKNGGETGTDCGGTACVAAGNTCDLNVACKVDADCTSGICDATSLTCVSCSDGKKNGAETATDCGGSKCVAAGKTCALTTACAADADCASGICDSASNICVSCSDGKKNGRETDLDCGGADCRADRKCAIGNGCESALDCEAGATCDSHLCVAGKTWSVLEDGAFSVSKVEDATAVSATDIWASGGDTLAHYTGSWTTEQPLGQDTPITGMFALDDGFGGSLVWVLSDDNVIKMWNGSGWFSQTIQFTGSLDPIAKLNDIHGTSSLMFVVGSEGQIARRDLNTDSFTSEFGGGGFPGGGGGGLPAPTSEDLYAVFVLDDNHAWAVGNNGAILEFNTGFWSAPTSPTGAALRDVWALAADNVWAVGDGGVIVHYDGANWSVVSSGVTANLASVWAADATHVWTVGAGGTVLFTDGASVSAEASDSTADLGVVFGFETTRWAMGTNAVLIQQN
jgi:hypothetical protein